ncbi:MAG: toll/interleukin-1 receptor domain-containing protein [Verrucomicrobiales bacterium]|nr:toll/interleukin-1 receptor domain-containing protein [Verrucomicrobiales bacterium]
MDPSREKLPKDAAKPEAPATAMSEPAPDVFLSYNSRDRAMVEGIANQLAEHGLRPFFDRWDLAPGLRWRPELERALAECGAVAVCLGPNGIGDVQKREVDVGLQRQDRNAQFPVIPVLLPGGETPAGFLEGMTWIDLRHQPIADGVAALAQAIRGHPGDPSLRQAARRQRNRYLLNMALLLVVVLGGVWWYDRHLQARLAHWAVGGSLTVVALAKMAYDFLKWGADSELKNLPKRLLGSSPSTNVLLAACGLVAVLLATTSSIQVRLDPGLPAAEEYAVEAASGGQPLWTSPRLRSDRPATSHLFFFRPGFDAEVRWVTAADRETVRVRLGLGRRAEVRVPSQFPPRAMEVVRLLPGARLLHAMGGVGDSVVLRYHLEVISGGSTQRVEDLRRQPVYLVRGDGDLDIGLRRETAEGRRRRFEVWAGEGGQSQIDLAKFWDGPPRSVVWQRPVPLSDLKLQLRSENRTEPLPLRWTVADATNEIRTVIVEKEP